MAEKRKDDKGRNLKDNEFQRSDGRYEYKFTDRRGDRHSVYSWRLVETDRTPPGKKRGTSLRELEKQILLDKEDWIDTVESQRLTLNDLFEIYISGKVELKDSTRNNYIYMYDRFVRDELGTKRIANIHFTDIKSFYVHLMHDLGFKPNSIETFQTILHPVFENAVRDGLIRINPTNGAIAEIKRSFGWEKTKRKALTVPQQEAFVSYVVGSKKYAHWLPLITVLLGTGCRIGEALGLRWEDCDFSENIITIDHALIYRQQDDGSMRFRVTTPKTRSGVRQIPMLNDVRDTLRREFARQRMMGFNDFMIDGYTGFIFSNRFGNPMSPHCLNRAIVSISNAYNAEETAKAEKENREPLLLPHFSAHHLRHTFCTRFCENETNLKVIQEIMGHASISTTMDVYNEATKEKKVESFANLEGKIKIS